MTDYSRFLILLLFSDIAFAIVFSPYWLIALLVLVPLFLYDFCSLPKTDHVRSSSFEDSHVLTSSIEKFNVLLNEDDFGDLKEAMDHLMALCDKMSRDLSFWNGIVALVGNEDSVPEYNQDNLIARIESLLFRDIGWCLNQLGIDINLDLNKKRGQLLLAISSSLFDDGDFRTFEAYSESMKNGIIDKKIHLYEHFINQLREECASTVESTATDFSIIRAIKDTHTEDRYLADARKWLNRLAVMIVCIDGMTSERSEWLTELHECVDDLSGNSHSGEKNPDKTFDDLFKLVGLQTVKEEISALHKVIEINRRREEAGMKTPPISYHCVFTGNPGTGKTTVARIVAGIYKELGILQKGHLVETDRSGLVAEYVGQTAVKTNKVIDSALDGVLFIDEAYSLIGAGNQDYGKEAIATLVKRMEDDRDRLVVILAGYEDEMQHFINSNPGLRSRFNRYIHFEDYTADELKQIFLGMVQQYDYVLQAEGENVLARHFAQCVASRGKDFGNARYVRNLFERSIKAQAVRLSSHDEADKAQLSIITADDITAAIADKT